MGGLSRAALERHIIDLPDELNREFLNKSMKGLREILQRQHPNDLNAQINALEQKKADFLAGKVEPKYFCKENGYAILLVLVELKTQKSINKLNGGIKRE